MTSAALLAVVLASVHPIAEPAPPDPTPAFASGAAAVAKAAFDAGRYGEAAQKLAAVKTPEAAFVRALALVEAGRGGEAVSPLEGLEARLPDIADRVAFLRGRALEQAGRSKEALAAWSAVPDGSRLASDARLARGKLAGAAGNRGAALEALAPILARPAPEDLLRPDLAATALLLAGRLQARGPSADPAGARRAFLDCWAAHPLAPEAQECAAALHTLPAPNGAEPGPEDRLRHAEALVDQNRVDLALKALERLVSELPGAAAGEPLACRARAALGRVYRRERNAPKAIELLSPVVEACEDPKLRVRSLFVLASATSSAGDKDRAIALYRRLARDYPDDGLADDALLFASDLLSRAGKDVEAREALAEIAREREGDRRDEARFRLAWLARRAGDADGALAQLLAIEESKRDQDPYEHARAAYWRARILAERGEAGARAARAIWTDLVQRYPVDYYGLLARARLKEGASAGGDDALPAPLAAPPLDPDWDPGALAADPHFRAGVALLRLGLPRDAAEELAAVDAAKLAGQGDAPEAVLVVADLLDRAGDHRTAHHLLLTRARVALRKAPAGPNLRAWRIAYPPAFRDDVKRFAPGSGVPTDLLQALMREESALDPRAVSPVGAIGLTQLMLPTAREIARQLRMPRPSRADLMRSTVNIRLGARYLGQLIRKFDGSVPLAVAAYNAGGGAVSRWVEARGALALDEFVEEIPFDETRGYVKRVLRSFAAYRLLYGATDAGPQLGVLKVSAQSTAAR
ncbi:MAG TPA: transglycosylase SLT domain-containing protein [Anaeromyxobacter sp.]|nr:transglycosylase SLT domain-containing protein [Anaeromyxobacter sp.]